MLSSSLNLSVTYTTNSRVPNTYPSQSSSHLVECSRLCLRTVQLDSRVSPQLDFVRGLQLPRALHLDTRSEGASNVSEFREQLNSSYLEVEGQPSGKETHSNNFVAEKKSCKNPKEIERMRKVGLANKGRVPWNKGKTHSAVTRELISQRTKEALKDPKVRKKMREAPRFLSNQTKAKIRTSITRIWEERLKLKRSRERFISTWGESIAKAAKKGGYGEKELDWDSYDKIQGEITLQKLQRSADVAKAKEMARIRAERRVKTKVEKEKLLLKKQMAKVKRIVKKKPLKKSKEEKEELAAAEDLKLKERLTKIHKKRSVNDQLSSQNHRSWERLDLESLKRDQRRKQVSFADQIRDVKNKKAEVLKSSDNLFTL